jgi:hypothetical protein
MFYIGSKLGWTTVSLPDKGLLIARCSSGKNSLHVAEITALMLGQLYVEALTVCGQRYSAIDVYCAVALQAYIKNILGEYSPPRFTC